MELVLILTTFMVTQIDACVRKHRTVHQEKTNQFYCIIEQMCLITKMKICVHKHTCKRMFIAALFMVTTN